MVKEEGNLLEGRADGHGLCVAEVVDRDVGELATLFIADDRDFRWGVHVGGGEEGRRCSGWVWMVGMECCADCVD